MLQCACEHLWTDNPIRILFEQIADKWSTMVFAALDPGPMRFNAIKRQLEGITQKALTDCLRRLERNGLVARHVLATSPVAVEYEMTPLGRSLMPSFRMLYSWLVENIDAVEAARRSFDHRSTT